MYNSLIVNRLLFNLPCYRLGSQPFFFNLWFRNLFFFSRSTSFFRLSRPSLYNTSKLFASKLYMKGIGYKFIRSSRRFPNFIRLELGYSVVFYLRIPSQLFVKHARTKLFMVSADFQILSRFTKLVQNMRRPDVYKAKGVRIFNVDYSTLKPGKQRLFIFYW